MGSAGSVELVWYANVTADTWAQAQAGLWWALSNLGADPRDPSAIEVRMQEEGEVRFVVHLDAVGFSASANAPLREAVAAIEASDAPLDVGVFLLGTLYEPGRYYAITGACATQAGWAARHAAETPERYAVTTSLLLDAERLVAFKIPHGVIVKLHAGTWHAAPLFHKESERRTFVNLELSDTNQTDRNTHDFVKAGGAGYVVREC